MVPVKCPRPPIDKLPPSLTTVLPFVPGFKSILPDGVAKLPVPVTSIFPSIVSNLAVAPLPILKLAGAASVPVTKSLPPNIMSISKILLPLETPTLL